MFYIGCVIPPHEENCSVYTRGPGNRDQKYVFQNGKATKDKRQKADAAVTCIDKVADNGKSLLKVLLLHVFNEHVKHSEVAKSCRLGTVEAKEKCFSAATVLMDKATHCHFDEKNSPERSVGW